MCVQPSAPTSFMHWIINFSKKIKVAECENEFLIIIFYANKWLIKLILFYNTCECVLQPHSGNMVFSCNRDAELILPHVCHVMGCGIRPTAAYSYPIVVDSVHGPSMDVSQCPDILVARPGWPSDLTGLRSSRISNRLPCSPYKWIIVPTVCPYLDSGGVSVNLQS